MSSNIKMSMALLFQTDSLTKSQFVYENAEHLSTTHNTNIAFDYCENGIKNKFNIGLKVTGAFE